MVNWEVQDVEAMNSLKTLQTQAGGFEGIGAKLGTSLETSATQSSMSGKGGMIAQAISEFVDKWKESLPGMVEHTGAVIQGSANAITALANGQSEMALAAQRGIQATEGVKPRAMLRTSATPPAQQV